MKFLDLCKTLHTEGGIAGLGPASTVNQTGMSAKIVRWVRESWIDIQSQYPNWKFLRKKEVRALTVNKRSYALVADLNLPNVRKWDTNLLFIRDPSTNKRSSLKLLEYPDFVAQYADFATGQPSVFTVTPDFNIEWDRTPDKAYSVELHFWLTGEKLEEDADIPSIPEDHHMTIVWWALVHYASHDEAVVLKADAKEFFKIALRRLEMDQLEIPHRLQTRKLA